MTDPTDRPLPDALLDRLRLRIVDPTRRVDQRPTQFQAGIASLDLGQLFGQLRQAEADLARIVEANQAGRLDPEMNARAEEAGVAMHTPVETPPPPPASVEALDRARERLGFLLPAALRQLYAEVADGGFGPGTGLLPIAAVAERYRTVQEETPRNQRWPTALMPLVDDNPVLDCLDASTPDGPVITWDPEDLSERTSDRIWQRSFAVTAPSLAAWLEGWLAAPSQDERMQDIMRQARIDSVRQSRAYFAAMTPEQRAGYGLPETGWERQIGDGLGLDDDKA